MVPGFGGFNANARLVGTVVRACGVTVHYGEECSLELSCSDQGGREVMGDGVWGGAMFPIYPSKYISNDLIPFY